MRATACPSETSQTSFMPGRKPSLSRNALGSVTRPRVDMRTDWIMITG